MRILFCMAVCEVGNVKALVDLGGQLQSSGFDPLYVLCDSAVCGGCQFAPASMPNFGCLISRCHTRGLVESRRLRVVNLSDYYGATEQVRFDWQEDAGSVSVRAAYQHLDLWDVCKGSIFRSLQRAHLRDGDQSVVGLFLSQAVRAFSAWSRILVERDPAALVVFQGMPYVDRMAAEAANQAGIATFAYENSCFKRYKFFLPGNFVVNRHPLATAAYFKKLQDRALDAEQRGRVSSFLQGVHSGADNQVRQSTLEPPAELRSRLGLEANRQMVLVLGQVPFDSVITYDSPHYPELMLLMKDILQIARAHRELDFVIRLHPLEGALFGNQTFHALSALSLPVNLRLVHSQQANTYQLMDIAAAGVVINSQTGLEMAAKGKPVVVCGTAFYGRKGFTRDLDSRDELETALLEVLQQGQSPSASESLQRFLHHFVFEYLKEYDAESSRWSDRSLAQISGLLREVSRPPAAGRAPVRPAPHREAAALEHAVRLLANGRPGEALQELGRIDESSGLGAACSALGLRALVAEGRIDEAVRRADSLLERHPDDPFLQAEALHVYGRAGNEAAARPLRQAHRRKYGTDALAEERYFAGLLEAGRHAEVIAELPGLIDEYPRSSALRHLLALALHRSGELGEAARWLRAAARLDPESESVRLDLGRLLRDRQELDEAKRAFRDALHLSSDGLLAAHLDLIALLLQQGAYAEAARQVWASMVRGPEVIWARAEPVRSLIEQGRLPEAAAEMRHFLAPGLREIRTWAVLHARKLARSALLAQWGKRG